jgi:hypothetical protein
MQENQNWQAHALRDLLMMRERLVIKLSDCSNLTTEEAGKIRRTLGNIEVELKKRPTANTVENPAERARPIHDFDTLIMHAAAVEGDKAYAFRMLRHGMASMKSGDTERANDYFATAYFALALDCPRSLT